MTTKKERKSNAARKIIPAAGMLMVSALMLSTSTYAWFTMSREVEVTGINMTAVVPENIQISLGDGQATGKLNATVDTGEGKTYRLATVTVPGNDAGDPDWSNTVVAADFYEFGRLTPATSNTGANIFYTKEATGVGKTLKGQNVGSDGRATQVDSSYGNALAEFIQANPGTASDYLTKNLTAAVGLKGSTAVNYADGKITNDPYAKEGAYYIDIPVWFRTSYQDNDVYLAVQATVSNAEDKRAGFDPNNVGSRSTDVQEDLYKAVRVSILDVSGENVTLPIAAANALTWKLNGAGDSISSQGVIYDSTTTTVGTGESAYTIASKYYAETATNGRPVDPAAAATISAASTKTDGVVTANTWAAINKVVEYADADAASGEVAKNTKTPVVKIGKGSDGTYGDAVRYTVRIWIDGEDENCWNATAGQDFTVALKFNKIAD